MMKRFIEEANSCTEERNQQRKEGIFHVGEACLWWVLWRSIVAKYIGEKETPLTLEKKMKPQWLMKKNLSRSLHGIISGGVTRT